ncbi:MAG: MFS transporter [Thermodesulfobacteriota bacterium]
MLQKPYYGWIIVGVTFLIGMTESGAVQNILSVFMKPMIAEFGWSRTAVTGSIAFGSICAGILSPFVGPLLDRHGPKLVAFWSILFMSIGLVCMSLITRIWQLYLFFGLGRMLAVGVLSMVITVTVSNWFIRQRGRAMGVTWLGPRMGSVILPALIQFIILTLGWRMAWGVLGTLIFLISGVPSWLFLRRRPEDIGLLPDGAPTPSENHHPNTTTAAPATISSEDNIDPTWTRAQALRTRGFWNLTFLHSLLPFIQAGINFHIFPFLTDNGLDEMTAVLVLSTIAVSGALGSVGWGYFSERYHIQRFLAVNIFSNGLVFLLLFWVVQFKVTLGFGVGIIFVLAAVHGLIHGGRHPIMDSVWGHFFGRKALGSIFSFASPFRFTANACGPVFAAFCFDIFGSYSIPFYLFTAIFFISGSISLIMKPPRPPSVSG